MTIVSLFWRFLERGGNQLIALVVQIVMARLLAPEDFGTLAIVLVFINIANIVVGSGLATSLIQSTEVGKVDFSTVFWISFTLAVVMYTALFVTAPYLAEFYQNAQLIELLRVLGVMLFVGALNSVQYAINQRNLQFKKLFKVSMVAVVLSGTVGILAALSGFGIWALVLQQILSGVVQALVLLVFTKWHPSFCFSFKLAKKHLSFSLYLLGASLLDVFYWGFADLLVGKMFGAKDLGYVSQGKKYPQALGQMLDGSIQPVMLSVVAKVKDDIPRVKGFIRRAMKTSTFVVFPALGMAGVVAEPLIRILLGEQWVPSTPFWQMYCFICACIPMHTTTLQVLNALGKTRFYFKIEVTKKVAGLVFLLVAAFTFGNLYAVIGSYVVLDLFSNILNFYGNNKFLGYKCREQLADIAPGALLTVFCIAITVPLASVLGSDALTILLQCIVFAVVYIVLAKLFKVEELAFILNLARSYLPK